ncbi:MAG: 50S ribosomal protein L3 [Candidatus Omnitrophica bacterium]|nr:50S ribosomal protein L3 [Candidatus Omnitrophota bacterium]
MIKGLLGKKIGMTQIFDRDGNLVPVTAVEVGPCTILELNDKDKKVKVGFEEIKASHVNKPDAGYFKKIGVAPTRYSREISSVDNKDYQVGQQLKADVFRAGDFVDVTGISVGKGFQGGMKRWHWEGGPGGHGSMHHRRVGSIGSTTFPGRTLKGHHMPGHMGNATATVQNLRVMDVDVESNTILIKGGIPGSNNSLVQINKSFKRSFKALDEVKVVITKKVNPMKQAKAAAGAKKAAPAKKK